MIKLNENSKVIYDEMEAMKHALHIGTHTMANGSQVMDAGIDQPGSLEAGLMYSRVCMAGLGSVTINVAQYADFWMPALQVYTSQPLLACMASQYAGWKISQGKFFAMGSGPARAKARVEDLFLEIDYADPGGEAVLTLEGGKLPSQELLDSLATQCGVDPEELSVIIAPTASLVGSVQISARVVEIGMHKLRELGFDLTKVKMGMGTAPVAPVAKNDVHAIGRTNDCALYGGKVYYTVRADDEEIEALIKQVPASASSDYGLPFYQTFKNYNYDFYEVDKLLFSPAQVTINNLTTGRVFQAGAVNEQVLAASLLGE